MANQRTTLLNFLDRTGTLDLPSTHFGNSRTRTAVATFTGDLAQNDILVLRRFKATDTILSAKLYMTAYGVAATGDLGVYVAGDWTVADQALAAGTAEDRFATAVTMNGAITAGTELWNESGTITADLLAKPLWQQLGLTTVPAAGTLYDVCLKVEGANPPSATTTVVFTFLAGD
jgi:hypothetical protein